MNSAVGQVQVNLEAFRRYAGLSLPRHVSYPMPSWWQEVEVTEAASMYQESRGREIVKDLALYLHIPFCEAVCRYCACTRGALPKNRKGAAELVEAYVSALEEEIRRVAEQAGRGRRLRQIHWGGGCPTYLSREQIERLDGAIRGLFSVAPDAERAIEVDPRRAPPEKLRDLRGLGFNRISLGVQDFDSRVQEHVQRIQPFEMVGDTVAVCRELGFESINFDLIYGLPYQTPETVRRTVEQTIELSPDRIAFYHYAQIPAKVAAQRGLDYSKLPDSEAKLEMFLSGLKLFESAGYEFIGLDHFAKPDEALVLASVNGTLQRSFQGMTTGGGLDLLGVGASSISHLLGIGFLQNIHQTDAYIACLQDGESPVRRGKRLTFDDRVRQAVISQLYCYACVEPATIEARFGVVFGEYFASELGIMRELEGDGLVSLAADGAVHVTFPLGRVLMRTVAAVFDAYLQPDAYRVGDREYFSANA